VVEPSRLSGIALFEGLSDETLEAVATAATEVEAGEGDVLAREGDFGHAMYVIETGTADVRHNGSSVQTLGPGDVFGEIAIIASGRRTADVVALSDMKMVALFKRDVWALESNNPQAAERLRELVEARRG
jgi:CPA1 family monovalent cation:H+ antiporter